MQRDKWLYLVAGERNIKNDIVSFANVGDAYDIDKRLKDPDYARKAAGGKWILLGKWNIDQRRDHDVHPIIEQRGFAFDKSGTGNSEEIELNMSIDNARDLISECVNELLAGVKNRKSNFSLRPEHQKFVKKASVYLQNNPGKPFLLNGKMRFGKSFSSYKLCEEMGIREILIVTYKPSVFSSWIEDLLNHVDLDGWGLRHIGSEENDVTASAGKPKVTLVSMQRLINGSSSISESLDGDDVQSPINSSEKKAAIDIVSSKKWDMLIVDEVHYGTLTQSATTIFDKITRNHTVYLSGTPYKRLLYGEFNDENSYPWSYNDEQEAKRADKASKNPSGVYNTLPEMKRILINLKGNPNLKRLISQYSEEEGFTMAKMFSTCSSAGSVKFRNEADVISFVDSIAKNGTARGFSPWAMNSPNIDVRMLNHTLWFLPRVDAISALAQMLNSHAFFGNFDIIEASGPTRNLNDVKSLKTRLKSNYRNGKKTIILACESLKEGITVPEIGAVIFLNDWKSPESYYQAAFRCQSPWVWKRNADGTPLDYKRECYVFDFNPSRALRLSYDAAEIDYLMTGKATEECLKRWHDNCPVLDNAGNSWKDDIKQAIEFGCSKSPTEKISTLFHIGRSNLQDLQSALQDVEANLNNLVTQKINDDAEKGKNHKKDNKQKKSSNEDKNKKEESIEVLLKKVQSVLMKLPTIVFNNPHLRLTSCKMIVDHVAADIFEEDVGVSLKTFKMMIDKKVINDYHDRCLLLYSNNLNCF